MTGRTRSEPSDLPTVSVMILAFNRREFLRSAVESVLRSDAPRGSYEILVVKNFQDPALDGFLSASGVRVFDEGPAPVGAWMAVAVRAARGRVVCMLNDDDEFEPGKISRVIDRFANVPHLTYYHDRRTLVDADGRPRPTQDRWEKPQRGPFTIVTDADRRSKVGTVHRFRGLFHDSCIAASRDVLASHMDDLLRVVVSEDAFTYYCALAGPGTLYFDDRRLTRFRVHARSKYRQEKTGPRDPQVSARRWALISTIEGITRGTAAERAARVFRIVTTHQQFLEDEGGPRPRAAEYWELFVCLARYRIPSHAILLGLSVLKVLAPRTTTAFFARFWAFLDDSVT